MQSFTERMSFSPFSLKNILETQLTKTLRKSYAVSAGRKAGNR